MDSHSQGSIEPHSKNALRFAPVAPAAFLLSFASKANAQGASPASAFSDAPLPPLDLLAEVAAMVAVLMLLQALLATSEIALLTLRKTRLKQLTEEGSPQALLVEKLLSDPARLMATIQMSVTMIAMLAASLASVAIVPSLSLWLKRHNPNLPASATLIGLVLAMAPIAGFSLIIGGVIPKTVAIRQTEKWALLSARPIYLLETLLSPAITFVSALSNLILRPFGSRASLLAPAVNEEELKAMVEASEEQGVLEAEETEMIHSVLGFSDTVVRKVMTPRIDVTSLPETSMFQELLAAVQESGHTRILIYEGDLDNVCGVVHAKDLLRYAFLARPEDQIIPQIMRAPYFIPESKNIADLLTEFRRSHNQLAIVRDEYGMLAGIVTLEDLVEEIVGEIHDEYDEEEPLVQVLDAENTIFDGRASVEDVNERMGLELPLEEADTIGGFVFGLLGHQAAQGEAAVWDGFSFVVEATDGRRITKVRLRRLRRDDFSDEGRASQDAAPQPPAETPKPSSAQGFAPRMAR